MGGGQYAARGNSSIGRGKVGRVRCSGFGTGKRRPSGHKLWFTFKGKGPG